MSYVNNRHLNWSGVTVVYGTGTPTTITIDGVQHVDVMVSDQLVKFIGDLGRFATLLAPKDGTRGLAIHAQNCDALNQIPAGTPCTVTAILNHPVNGSGVGSNALQFVLSNAVRQSNPINTGMNRPAEGTASFMAFSADGTTDPMAITRL